MVMKDRTLQDQTTHLSSQANQRAPRQGPKTRTGFKIHSPCHQALHLPEGVHHLDVGCTGRRRKHKSAILYLANSLTAEVAPRRMPPVTDRRPQSSRQNSKIYWCNRSCLIIFYHTYPAGNGQQRSAPTSCSLALRTPQGGQQDALGL